MGLVNPIKAVTESNLPIEDWNERIDPGTNRAVLRPMTPVTGDHRKTSRSAPSSTRARSAGSRPALLETPTISLEEPTQPEQDFASWLLELREEDPAMVPTPPQGRVLSPPQPHEQITVAEDETDKIVTGIGTISKPEEPPGDVAFLLRSVNDSQEQLDTAFYFLELLGLDRSASWTTISLRYSELDAELCTDNLDPISSQAARKARRQINIAYASLRLLAARPVANCA